MRISFSTATHIHHSDVQETISWKTYKLATLQRICRRFASSASSSTLSRGLTSATLQQQQHQQLQNSTSFLLTQRRTMGGITIDNINPKVKDMQYAVRGAIVSKAGEIEAELKELEQAYRLKKKNF